MTNAELPGAERPERPERPEGSAGDAGARVVRTTAERTTADRTTADRTGSTARAARAAAGGQSDVLVSCVDAARTFGRGAAAVVAVHGATCEVRAGDRIAVSGPSGSGKSTLLHLLAGLERPSSGQVSWPGLGSTGSGAVPVHQIGVVFQGPSLIPALDVTENTGLPLVLAGVKEAEAHRRAADALALLGVDGLARRLPEELSGGQAQRVAIARVLALSPRLVLADEPTGQLDGTTARHVIDVLLTAVDAIGAALVVTTHDPAVAERLATRRQMHEGRLLDETGTARGATT